nr:hypothetical protein [Homo sapiens]
MAIKKQKRCRKIRPVSAFISGSPQDMESQLGNLGIPPGWFSGLGGSQPTASGSWEGLSELPTHGYKLRHQTQGRPRPPRTTPPGPGRPSMPAPGTRQENGMATRLDEGLEDFFSRRVLEESSSYPRTLRTVRPGLSEAPLPPLQKKRRRGLFHFRRPWSFKGDRGPGSPTTGLLLPPPPPPPPTQESPPSPDPPSLGNNSSPCWSPEEESSLLPGFGGGRGPSFRRKMGPGPDQEGSTQAWQKRRSSDDAGPGSWKPPPPPQSTKPSFSAMRRAEATWHIAEESAPNHSCQSPSPASQDGEEEKEGTLFPERTLPARNAKLQDPALAPWPPKPVAVPRGRQPPQEPGVREEAEAGDAAPGVNKPRLRLSSQQDQEEPEVQGPPDPGRRTAPLKPKRTRRAQSCDKLEPDRRRPPDPTGTSEPGTD